MMYVSLYSPLLLLTLIFPFAAVFHKYSDCSLPRHGSAHRLHLLRRDRMAGGGGAAVQQPGAGQEHWQGLHWGCQPALPAQPQPGADGEDRNIILLLHIH